MSKARDWLKVRASLPRAPTEPSEAGFIELAARPRKPPLFNHSKERRRNNLHEPT